MGMLQTIITALSCEQVQIQGFKYIVYISIFIPIAFWVPQICYRIWCWANDEKPHGIDKMLYTRILERDVDFDKYNLDWRLSSTKDVFFLSTMIPLGSTLFASIWPIALPILILILIPVMISYGLRYIIRKRKESAFKKITIDF